MFNLIFFFIEIAASYSFYFITLCSIALLFIFQLVITYFFSSFYYDSILFLFLFIFMFFIFFIVFLIFLCFIFLYIFFYLKDKNKNMITFQSNNNLVLCLDNGKMVETSDVSTIYTYNNNKYINLKLNKQKKWIRYFLNKIPYKSNIFLLLYKCTNDPHRLLLLLSHFDFLYYSYFIFNSVQPLLRKGNEIPFLYKSKHLKYIKKKIIKSSNKKQHFFVQYIYYKYYSVFCNSLTVHDLLFKLNSLYNSSFFICSTLKKDPQDTKYIHIDLSKIKKKYIFLFLQRFILLAINNSDLVNNYLSMILAIKIQIKKQHKKTK